MAPSVSGSCFYAHGPRANRLIPSLFGGAGLWLSPTSWLSRLRVHYCHKTPLQAIRAWQAQKPELLNSRNNNKPSLDTCFSNSEELVFSD